MTNHTKDWTKKEEATVRAMKRLSYLCETNLPKERYKPLTRLSKMEILCNRWQYVTTARYVSLKNAGRTYLLSPENDRYRTQFYSDT